MTATNVHAADLPTDAPARSWLPPAPTIGLILLLSTAFVALFHFFFIQQFRFSRDSADWQHAFFVPLISLYMVWQWRDRIFALRPTIFWPGLIPLLLSVPAYMLFQIGSLSNHMGQGFSMILGLFGLLLFLLGPRMIQPLFLPIAFLVFGVTISEMVMIQVTFRLQGIAAEGGYVLLNLVGITTDLKGHTLQVTHPKTGTLIPLNIAEACSGMRMLIAFMALGVAVALVGLKHWWQRIALILTGVPVALVMNILRVVVLGVLSLSNPEWAKGQAHMFIGMVLLFGAFIVFMGIAWALQKVVNEDDASVQAKLLKEQKAAKARDRKAAASTVPAGLPWPTAHWSMLTRPAFVTAVGLMLVSTVGSLVIINAVGLKLRKLPIHPVGDRQVAAVPTQTASWMQVGTDTVMSSEMIEELGTKNYVSRAYALRSGKSVPGASPAVLELHLAYYTGMIDTVPHVPDRCMTGAGFMMVEDAKVLPLNLDRSKWRVDDDATKVAGQTIYYMLSDPDRSDAPNTRCRLPRGIEDVQMRFTSFQAPSGGSAHAAYFFIANGGLTPSANDVRILAFNLKAEYAYFLKVQVSSNGVTSSEQLAALSSSLLGELIPEISRVVPDWIEVQRGEYPADNPRRVRPAVAAKP